MAQTSGPISQGTASERQMTDVLWRDLFGDEAGVYGDTNGTAYRLVLATDSNTASVGSSQIDSMARVAGFSHKIPAGQPETIEIPNATGTARTDILALEYDPASTGLPGPVRLVRIPGTSAGIPAYDAAPPGIEHLPLWAITRQPGQALSQATTVRMFPRVTPMLDVPVGAPLPLNSPIGSRVWQGNTEYVRTLGTGGNPAWVALTTPAPGTAPATLSLLTGVANSGTTVKPISYWRETRTAFVVGTMDLTTPLAGLATRAVANLPAGFRPSGIITAASNLDARFEVLPSGRINVLNGNLETIPARVPLPMHLVIPL